MHMKQKPCLVCNDDLNPYSICGGCDNRAYKKMLRDSADKRKKEDMSIFLQMVGVILMCIGASLIIISWFKLVW